MRHLVAAFTLASLASATTGKTLAEVRAIAPTATVQSARSIYDVERCIVGLDMLFLPSVYSQPDRPNEREIAFGGAGQGVRYLFRLSARGGATDIRAWAQSGELKPSVAACF